MPCPMRQPEGGQLGRGGIQTFHDAAPSIMAAAEPRSARLLY